MSSDREVIAESWFWMSEASDDAAAKRAALENCLANDPLHARARRALAIVDGHLRPDEIVDPDRLPVGRVEGSTGTRRFVCAKCGGRMVYAPDGQSLICDYCARRQTVALDSTQAGEQDFIVAMATMRGHGKPLLELVFHCQGCGAEFILPAGSLSFTCAYCDSPHVVNVERSNQLLAPDGITMAKGRTEEIPGPVPVSPSASKRRRRVVESAQLRRGSSRANAAGRNHQRDLRFALSDRGSTAAGHPRGKVRTDHFPTWLRTTGLGSPWVGVRTSS